MVHAIVIDGNRKHLLIRTRGRFGKDSKAASSHIVNNEHKPAFGGAISRVTAHRDTRNGPMS